MKLNRKKIIGELYKEFKTLEKGKKVRFIIQPNMVSVELASRIYWESDITAQHDDPLTDNMTNKFLNNLEENFNLALEPELKKFNKQIKDFIEKCDALANSLGEDKHAFFESMMEYGHTKTNTAYFKAHMKKEIKSAEKNLEKLKRKMQNGI